MITQRINLNLVPGGAPERIRCSQYDSGSRVLDLALYNGDVPFDATGCTAVIQGTKIDDTGFQYACTVDGTHVYADITQQMTVYSGQVPCEIRLTQNDEILGTANFLLIVEKSALTDDTIISDTELPLIEQAAEIATTIAATAEQVATDADRAEDALSNIYTGLASKQDILTAGDNITIEGATISADVITDYEDLTSIPTLDGTEIKGTLTKAGLNIATATDLATKQDALTAGTNITIEDNVISATAEGGTTDYTELTNKPQINSVELSGNKSLTALGIASESDLSALSITVGTKADASTVESLATTVSSKADQSDLTALATTVSGKQDTLTFDTEPTEDSANPVTSGGVYDALGDKADQSEVDGIAENTESETATLSGNPISLSDALATDAISVVAEIEPEQDLHGYGKPWSGGAGKNKARTYTFTGTNASVTFSYDDNGVTLSGTASGDTALPFSSSASSFTFTLPAGTYTSSMIPTKEGVTVQIVDQSTGNVVSNNPTFTTDNDKVVYYRLSVMSGIVSDGTYKVQLESGSQATTFEPYTNICPISGMDSVTVTTTDGTDTNTITTSLGTTIYGGSVDMTTGVMTVNWVSVTLTGDNVDSISSASTTDADGGKRINTNISHVKYVSGTVTAIADKLAWNNNLYFEGTNAIGVADNGRLGIRIAGAATLEDAKTALDNTNIQVVYELATPTTLSLTPATLAMLEGENTISTDAEEVSVEYVKNTLAGRVKHLEDESGVIDYSTTEQKTGQKWIDGKDIYQKTIDFGALPNNTSKSVDISALNIDLIIDKRGVAYNSDKSTMFVLPHLSLNASSSITMDANRSIVAVTTSVDRSNIVNCYITLYYTKTT